MITQILGEAVVIVVTAALAEKASEKWKKPLWIVFVILVFSVAGLQIHSERVEARKAEQQESSAKQQERELNGMLDSVGGQLQTSLLKQAEIDGQLKAMQLIMGNLAQAGYPGMKEIASALTTLSRSNAQQNPGVKTSTKELCDRAIALAVKLREFQSNFDAERRAIDMARMTSPPVKTQSERMAIIEQQEVTDSQAYEQHTLQFRNQYIGDAIHPRIIKGT
jgi:hypothetical protein